MKFEFLTRTNVNALHTLCTGDKPEFASANKKRQEWFDEMFRGGLRGWIAFQDHKPAGYIEYLPIEAAPFPVTGQDANFITCLWVLPQYQHQGLGGSLLAACIGDSARGLATIGYHKGEHKPVNFFAHFGFEEKDHDGDSVLLTRDCADVHLERVRYRPHASGQRLAVDVLYNPECPWSTRTAERVVDTVKAHPAFPEIDLWIGDAWACGAHQGLFGGIYLNGIQPFTSPPSDADIQRAIDDALVMRVPSDA